MKKLFPFLLIISTIFFLSGYQSDKDPKAVYNEFTQGVRELSSIGDDSIDHFLSKRALGKKKEGISRLTSLPEDQRLRFEAMALVMLKQTGTWLDSESSELEIKENTASLVVSNITMGTEINTSLINFVKEDGWKIDYFTKESRSSDPENTNRSSESIFK